MSDDEDMVIGLGFTAAAVTVICTSTQPYREDKLQKPDLQPYMFQPEMFLWSSRLLFSCDPLWPTDIPSIVRMFNRSACENFMNNYWTWGDFRYCSSTLIKISPHLTMF